MAKVNVKKQFNKEEYIDFFHQYTNNIFKDKLPDDFETTILTQLSTVDEMNSFGREIKYVEPEYLLGYLGSILQVESYFKIFVTSFLGVALFKLTFFFIDLDSFISLSLQKS